VRLVFDACVIVKLLVPEVDSDVAAELFERSEVLVPDWSFLECSHALWKKRRAGLLSDEECRKRFGALSHLELETHESQPLLEPARELALVLDHDVYDCLYLALAVAEDCQLVTCDEELVRAARQAGLKRVVAVRSFRQMTGSGS